MDDSELARLSKQFESVRELIISRSAYGDAWKELGSVGLTAMLFKKATRLKNIVFNNLELTEKEKVEDTLKDLIAYAGMMLLLIEEKEAGQKKVGEF